jgi:uncharacterized membrane protein required for colicin V production
MGLDIVCLAIVAVFVVLGLLSGFLAQIVRLAALIGAFLLAYSASVYTRPLLMRWMDVDSIAGNLLSLLLGWIGCYIAIIVIGTIVVRILKNSSDSIKLLDRFLGGALGSVKGLLIVYLLACALVLLRAPLQEFVPEKQLDLKESRFAAFAERHNVFSRIALPEVDKLKELTAAFDNQEGHRALLDDRTIMALRRNQAFQRLMKDEAFHKAVSERQLDAILNNPSLRAAMNDPEIRKILSTLDLERISEISRQIR